MFIVIELLGMALILWFIANFVRYIGYTITGIGNEMQGGLFALSDNWIKTKESKKCQTKGKR